MCKFNYNIIIQSIQKVNKKAYFYAKNNEYFLYLYIILFFVRLFSKKCNKVLKNSEIYYIIN